jgi:dTDP-4-amino-4,6-dideoxygalactose transaminase
MPAILPPVRRPVPLGSRRPRESLEALFAPYGALICGSGTQALALAIADARIRSDSARPEVILPAYACPDLITASVYAGVYPRLVDTAAGEWGYDLGQLRTAISSDTVAVVAVNLLGVGDQASRLRQIATECDTLLIQDSAQHLPPQLPAAWLGDYVVLSFGRGKPLNLLRGGALLHPSNRAADLAAGIQEPAASTRDRFLESRLAGLAFNVATHPGVYAFSSRLLGGSLGSTRYKTLAAIRSVSAGTMAQVASGLCEYRDAAGYDASIWRAACEEWLSRGIEPLRCNSQESSDSTRLRLPLLARDERLCAAIVAALNARGLGASRLYGTSLERIADVPIEVARQGPFPNAAELARRLFTLPTHSSVSSDAVRLARETVAGVLQHFRSEGS